MTAADKQILQATIAETNQGISAAIDGIGEILDIMVDYWSIDNSNRKQLILERSKLLEREQILNNVIEDIEREWLV